MTSALSWMVIGALRAVRRKHRYADLDAFRRYVAATRDRPHAPPASVTRRVRVRYGEVRGWPCYTVTPRRGPTAGRHVLYLHGGSYVFQMVRQQWDLVRAMAQRFGCPVTVPAYPLPPAARAA